MGEVLKRGRALRGKSGAGRRPAPGVAARAPGEGAPPLRLLLVEDTSTDAELTQRELARGGIVADARIVQTEADFRRALAEHEPQIILSDFALPEFDGARALAIARESAPEIPFIFVSGTMGEEIAVRALREGATDYILKGNLARLCAAVTRALEEVRERDALRNAERELRESEARLQRAQALAGLGHIVSGPEGEFASWSDTLPRMLGLEPGTMPRSTREWLQRVHPDDRAAFRANAIQAAKAGARAEFEYRIHHADGSWVHLRQITEPMSEDERGTRWFGTILDITRQTEAAAALLASEERYRATFEQAAVGVVHTSLEGEIRMVNQAFCGLVGYGRAEAIQLHIRDVTHPEDFARSAQVRANIIGGTGGPYQRELRLLRKDRSYLWASVTTSLVRDAAGKPQAFVSVLSDISERKRTEHDLYRFRAAMDITIDSIYLTDPETMRFLYVNEAACQRLGYAREELMRKTSHEVVGKAREEVQREYEAAVAAGERGTRLESRFVRKDGSEGWTELHRRALTVDGKTLIVTLGRDITDRKRAALELAASEARFRSLSELSSDWYWEQDEEHRFTAFSGGSDKWGGDQNEQIGKRRWELPGAVPLSASWEEHRALLEARRAFTDFEYARAGADGAARYVSSSGEPVFDQEGRFRGYRGTAKDISARKRAEAVLRLEHTIELRLAEAESAPSGLQAAIRHLCEAEGWLGGRYWRADPEAGVLRFGEAWGPPGSPIERYNEDSREIVFRAGTGFAGRVWQSGEPLWVADTEQDGRALRRDIAPGVRKRSTFLFPVFSEGRAVGVLAFDSDQVRAPDERLLRAVHVIGVRIGQFLRRKKAEEALRESEARFRSLSTLSSDWFWQTDAEHRFIDTPDRVTQLTGMRANAYVGKRRWEVDGLRPTSGDWSAHKAVLARRESYRDFELVQTKADGSRAYLQVSGEPAHDESGNFAGYRGTAKDITAQKRSEEELRRFRLAMDGSADIILLIDRATMRYVDCNATACRLLGYAREELLKLGPADVLPVTRAELERTYDEMIASQQPASGMRSYYRCKDGSQLPFESTRRPLRSGDSWLIVAVSRDIREQIAADNALRESEARFRSLTALSSDFYWETDTEHRVVRAEHGSAGEHPVVDPGQVGKARWETPSTHPGAEGWAAHKAIMDAHRPFREFEVARLGKDGVERWRSLSGEPVFDAAGAFKGYRGVGRDITERKLQQRRIERLSRVYALLSGINAAIVRIRNRDELYREACRTALEEGGFRMAWIGVVDAVAERIRPVAWRGVDEAYIRAMPLELNEVPGRPSLSAQVVRGRKAVVSDDMASDPRITLRVQAGERGFRALAILPLIEGGEVAGVLALYAAEAGFFDEQEMKLLNELAGDISFALEVISKDEKINYLALHDPLTGLANRTLLLERLGQSMQSAGREGAKFVLAWLDLERLTTVNESLGRQAGDALIRQVGERLAAHAGGASVARIAADNFAVVLPTVKGRSEAGRVLTSLLRECFAEPYPLEGDTELKVAAKAGLALFPNDGADAETLLGNAEAAHRKAKETGERHVFYTPDLTERTGVSLTLENKLRRALENDEFVLHYQPKVEVESRRIVGMEGLIRWQSPELGLVPPGNFIPIMEETGMILDVGTWALKRASLDHRRWTEMNLRPPRVAVNVSPIQLRQKDFVAAVEAAIMEGVAPIGIDLEITESLIMEDIEGNIGKLHAVRELGAGLAVDDFGTGYSSLAYLAKLPVQTLKIDRSFVITMLKEPDTMTLVQTIISLAHSLRLKVVAEGVDAEEQAKVLRLLRCDEMQGFLFSKPVPFEDLTALLRAGRG